MLYAMRDGSVNSRSLSKHAPDDQALQGSLNAQGTLLSWLEQLSKTRQWLSLEQTEGLVWRQGRPFFCSWWHKFLVWLYNDRLQHAITLNSKLDGFLGTCNVKAILETAASETHHT